MLGYAIEAHLKEALGTVLEKLSRKEEKLLRRGHDLPALFEACRGHDFFQDVEVSPEFLEFASDHLNQRYPTQQKGVLERRGASILDSSKLWTFDDLILQLDDSLSLSAGDARLSLAVEACRWMLPDIHSAGTQLFHANPFALKRIPAYLRALQEQKPEGVHDHSISELERGPEALWEAAAGTLGYTGKRAGRGLELAELSLAKLFRRPEARRPDPDPSRRIFKSLDERIPREARSLMHYSKRLLHRLREEFGELSLEVVVEGPTGPFVTPALDHKVLIYVLDRRATPWHRTLTARAGPVEWIPNDQNLAELNAWIEDARSSGFFAGCR